MKITVSQAQKNGFVFKETPVYKRGVRRSAHPRYEQGWGSSKTVTHGDVVRVLSSVFIIGQSDTRNRGYLISWL